MTQQTSMYAYHVPRRILNMCINSTYNNGKELHGWSANTLGEKCISVAILFPVPSNKLSFAAPSLHTLALSRSKLNLCLYGWYI